MSDDKLEQFRARFAELKASGPVDAVRNSTGHKEHMAAYSVLMREEEALELETAYEIKKAITKLRAIDMLFGNQSEDYIENTLQSWPALSQIEVKLWRNIKELIELLEKEKERP